MKEEVLQIGTQGADIEMHIAKNQAGIYFVSFRLFGTKDGVRFAKTNGGPVYPFNSKEEIYEMFGKMMNGKEVTI